MFALRIGRHQRSAPLFPAPPARYPLRLKHTERPRCPANSPSSVRRGRRLFRRAHIVQAGEDVTFIDPLIDPWPAPANVTLIIVCDTNI